MPVSKMWESIEALIRLPWIITEAFPAYPSGNSWDEAFGKTGSGKKFLHNVIPGADFNSLWTETQSIPVETVNSWTTPSFSREENTTCTEASYSCMATKGACKDSSCTADIVL